MESARLWKCDICGYMHRGDGPPDICPICGVDASHFVAVDLPDPPAPATGAVWRCNVCGYVHNGSAPPDQCPVCSVPAVHFTALPSGDVPREGATALSVVVIGAGIAGLTAAETLAAGGAEVTLISREQGLPYFRLNLTRYLAGEVSEAALTMKDADWFAAQGIKLLDGDVVRIDREQKTVSLRDGRTLRWDRLILATGAHPFVPPLTGSHRQGVTTLRTLADTRAIIDRATKGAACVCIGGGLLGLEAAGALSRRGCAVTVIEGFDWILPRQLPEEAARLLADHLQQTGITVLTGARTKEICGDEHVRAVLLEDGRQIPADLVLISTGVRPNSYLARQCGLHVAGGIAVDDNMRTGDPDIFAAGDAVEHRGVLYGIWPAAFIQGVVAAQNVLGGGQEWSGMPPSNRLKVLSVDLFSIGTIAPSDGSFRIFDRMENGRFLRLVTRDNTLRGAVLLGDTAMAGLLQDVIESKAQLSDRADLLDAFPFLAD